MTPEAKSRRSAVDLRSEGYFREDAAIRRIARESVLMLGGPRALLMQAAHPLVAAGIVDHSRFRQDPWRRLARTMSGLYTIVFGTREQADLVGAVTRTAHERVYGRRGTRTYSAADPALMLWVHSTLVDTGLVMYETYVRRLELETAEDFYQQMKVVATLFGVPPDVHPPTLDDFRSYQRSSLESGEVREQYGVRWTRADGLALRASSQSCRRLLPLLPGVLRRTERLPLRLVAAFAGH
jgi:uncharacterized protein (DUF2236 family)